MMRSQKGFTLIEVLLSVVILAVGLLGVYRPLLMSLSALRHSQQHVEAARLIHGALWELQEKSEQTGQLVSRLDKGTLHGQHTVYHYRYNAAPVLPYERLYEVEYRLTWHESGRGKSLTRNGYVYVPEIEETPK